VSEADGRKAGIWGKVAATALHQDPLDGAATNEARVTSPMSNLKVDIGGAQLALILPAPDPLTRLELPMVQPLS